MPGIERQTFDYADTEVWPTAGSLSIHIKQMLTEQKDANPRKAAELETTIGHAVFELYHRRQEEGDLIAGAEADIRLLTS